MHALRLHAFLATLLLQVNHPDVSQRNFHCFLKNCIFIDFYLIFQQLNSAFNFFARAISHEQSIFNDIHLILTIFYTENIPRTDHLARLKETVLQFCRSYNRVFSFLTEILGICRILGAVELYKQLLHGVNIRNEGLRKSCLIFRRKVCTNIVNVEYY